MEKTPEEIKNGLECCTVGTCRMCPYKVYTTIEECTAALTGNSFAYIQQLEAQVPRWIPVEERLPEVDDDVLVCSGARIDIGYYDGLWWETYTIRDIPTHWMLLPQPPKGGCKK